MPRAFDPLLLSLTALYVLSMADRHFLATAVQHVRADLGVTQVQYGVLTGLAFAACYTLVGLPMGRLADRGGGGRLIAAGVLVWSLATAACGLARSYHELLAARMLVGCGEAVLVPTAFALMAQRYAGADLARAAGVFSLGPMLGAGLALFVGGPLIMAADNWPTAPLAGWRLVFIGLGALGVVAAAMSLRLPRSQPLQAGETARLGLRDLAEFIGSAWPWLAPFALGATALTAFALGLGAWQVALMREAHGWSVGQTGVVLGIGLLTVGIVAGPVWGLVNAHLMVRLGGRGGFALLALASLGCLAVVTVVARAPAGWAAAGLFVLPAFTGAVAAIAPETLLARTPALLRGQAIAALSAVLTLVGMTAGPLMVGAAAELLFQGQLNLAVLTVSTILLSVAAASFVAAGLQARAPLPQSVG